MGSKVQTWDSASRLATPADLLNLGRKAADTFEWKIFMADNDVSILRTSAVEVRNRSANPRKQKPVCISVHFCTGAPQALQKCDLWYNTKSLLEQAKPRKQFNQIR